MDLGLNNKPNRGVVERLILLLVIYISVVVFICSCRTLPQPAIIRDTSYISNNIHTYDSIFIHDSIYVKVTSDTIFMEKWHTKYIDRLKVDSIIRIDSIPVPYEVIKEIRVEKKLSKFQQVKLYFGNLFLTLIVVFSLGYIIPKVIFKK